MWQYTLHGKLTIDQVLLMQIPIRHKWDRYTCFTLEQLEFIGTKVRLYFIIRIQDVCIVSKFFLIWCITVCEQYYCIRAIQCIYHRISLSCMYQYQQRNRTSLQYLQSIYACCPDLFFFQTSFQLLSSAKVPSPLYDI